MPTVKLTLMSGGAAFEGMEGMVGKVATDAANHAAVAVVKAIQTRMEAVFTEHGGRPDPTVVDACQVIQTATADDTTAIVGYTVGDPVRDVEINRFLSIQEQGSIEAVPPPGRQAYSIPRAAARDPYSSLRGKATNPVQALLADKNNFYGTIDDKVGIWERVKGKHPILLVEFRKEVSYAPIFDSVDVFEETVRRVLPQAVKGAFDGVTAVELSAPSTPSGAAVEIAEIPWNLEFSGDAIPW
jgi:hypothetical protein